MSLPKIIRLLASLDDTELAELEARVKSLRQTGSAVTPAAGRIAVQTDETFVLLCIAELLTNLGAGAPSLPLLARWVTSATPDGSSFRAKVPYLMSFLHGASAARIEQRALLCLGIEFLYLDMHKRNVAISPKLLMANIHRIPGLIDQEFPGYARAGLLGWIVDRRAAEREPSNGH